MTKRHRMVEFGAATALTSGVVAGAFGIGEAGKTVEGKAVPAPPVASAEAFQGPVAPVPVSEAPSPTHTPTTTPEIAPVSPKNEVRRCVFAAGRAAILDIMRSPVTTIKEGDKTIYIYGSERQPQASVAVDTLTTPGQAILDYELQVGAGEYTSRGEITIPLDGGTVEDSLEAADPQRLHEDYEIADRSAVFDLQNLDRATTIKETYTDEQAAQTCDVADDFIEAADKEYK